MLKHGDKLAFKFNQSVAYNICTFDHYDTDNYCFFFSKEDPGMFNYLPHYITLSEYRKLKLEKISKCEYQ